MYVSAGIVVGFHGCDASIFDNVIKYGGSLNQSENTYDWLGHGVYFWEGSYDRALDWAKSSRKIEKPAVIGAFIKLGNCIDLLDEKYLSIIKKTYSILKSEYQLKGETLPKNTIYKDDISFVRDLDCKVIMRMQYMNNELIAQELKLVESEGLHNKRAIQNHPKFYDTVRGMFPEGKELYSEAGFRDKNHIQICAINPNTIIGYFNPLQKDALYKDV